MPPEPIRLDDVPLPVLEVRDGSIVDASPAALELLGGPEVLGRSLVELLVESDRPAVREALAVDAIRRAHDEPTTQREIAVRLDAADRRPIGLLIRRVDDHHVVGLADHRLERRLAAVIDAVADSTLLLDADGVLLWQSDALAAHVPGGRANLGSHPVERLHPEDLPLVLEHFAELSTTPSGRVSQVVRSRSVDDDDVWQLIEVIGAGRADHPDLGGVVVQVRNLDEGAELESVAYTDGPMHSLAEAAPIGILLLNRSLTVVFANRAGRDLLELSATADVSGWRDRVMGSHRATLDDQIAAALGGTAPDSATMPFQAAAGSSGRWLRVRIAPHLGASHQVVGLIAALEDVTAEVEARTESERLLYMLDTTSDFVTVFRPTGEILHTNTALGQVLERLAREGGTGRLVDLLGEERRDRFMANALNAVEGSDSWEGELEIHIGGGRSIPVSVLAVVRRDETGAIDWIAMTARDITRAKVAEEALRQAATVDHLTGLANRALFTDRLEQAARASERSGRRLAVLFCDLDRFKQVNDVYGHAVGDSVLRTIAMRLRDITREGDLAARVGGDEFVILCEGVTDPDVLAALADRVITSITRPIETPGGDVQVGISIGLAISQGPQVDGDRLLIVSDQAMYLAKAGGGNRYRVLSLDR